MFLAEKFQQIAAGSFKDFTETKWTEEVREHHSVGNSTSPVGYLFETNTYLASSWSRNGIDDARLFLGAESYINTGGYLRGNVLIGRFCSVGRRVTIGAGSHPLASVSTSPRLRGFGSSSYSAEERKRIRQPSTPSPFITIQSDVWIGDGAVIMPGITLAVGSVVAANAVVTEDTEPYEIVGGVPAHTIRKRFDNDTIKELLKTKWWEGNPDDLNKRPAGNVFEFLNSVAKASVKHHTFETWCVSD